MKRILVITLVVALVFAFAACSAPAAPAASQEANVSKPAESSPATVESSAAPSADAASSAAAPAGNDIPGFTATPADPNELYIHVSCYGSLDYFYDHKVGTQIAAKILGVKSEYVGPAGYDMDAMITAFEQAIAKKPAGIIVFGADATLASVIDKASDAGIPVVCVDGDVANSKRVAFVGTGHFNAGVMGGKKLVEMLGGKGEVALMTVPGQSHLEQRIAGYKSVLDQYPDIKVVQIGDTQTDPTVAAQAAAAIIQKYPNLSAFACVEASGGQGCLTAVKEANKIGQIKIMSMDRGSDVLQAIKDGAVSATIVQQTALMPIYAMEILYNLKHYGVPITSDNAKAGLTGTPINIDTGCVIVDKNNVDYFVRK
jgi:ribose transport system substrate-binding protein